MSIPPLAPVHTGRPTIFEEFFGLGEEESVSPFLTPSSRKWAAHLTLKAAALSAVMLLLAFIFSFYPRLIPLSHLLLVGVYFCAGIPSLIESIEDLLDLDINIDMLMTLAAFSSILIGSSMEGALLLVLFSLSGAIEDSVTAKAKGSITWLHKLSPSKACVVETNGHLIERSIKDIAVGTPILIKAGEVVPLDGRVIAGISTVNMVHLTGENTPLTKQLGDEVPAGARNMEGSLTLEVTHASADSTLSRIVKLVTEAQESRPKLQRWFDSLSRGYAMSIIAFSALIAISLPFLLGLPLLGKEGSVYRALTFLIAASPCALILAIPIAYLSSVSACARRGILLKGGVILDALAQCSQIAFDKTGTLTTGRLKYLGLEEITGKKSWNENDLLAIAYALERNAVHPIAQAVCQEAMLRSIPAAPIEQFKLIPGYGLEGSVETPQGTFQAFMGHPAYIEGQLPPDLKPLLKEKIAQVYERGELLAVLSVNSQLFILTFQDTLRPDLKETIDALKKRGQWKLLMLTGDHASSAKRIADSLGIDEYYADLRPEDKLEHVSRLSKEGGLAMVGDGINDAPALARATVGIGMGKVGSGAAIEAADVVLLNDNLEQLDWLMAKAKTTQAVVKQNLTIAALAILVAALPALAGIVPLWIAVLMHEGGTVLVGLNGLRLLK